MSDNPKNHRLRSSLLIQGTVTLVIDTSVDFRVQMLRHGVRHLDALLYTHSHVDHILGLDDVYPFNMWSERTVPAYGSEATLNEIAVTFRHLFDGKGYPGIPSVELIPVAGSFRVGDLEIEPIDLMHGRMPVLGFRIGRFAYLTDVSYIPEVSFEASPGGGVPGAGRSSLSESSNPFQSVRSRRGGGSHSAPAKPIWSISAMRWIMKRGMPTCRIRSAWPMTALSWRYDSSRRRGLPRVVKEHADH